VRLGDFDAPELYSQGGRRCHCLRSRDRNLPNRRKQHWRSPSPGRCAGRRQLAELAAGHRVALIPRL
jgi:hypothetical protein